MEITILEEAVSYIYQQFGEELNKLTVERAVLGLFFSGVKLSSGSGGLCYTPIKELPQAVCCPSSAKEMPLSGKLADRPVKEYLEDIFKPNVLRKTLGIATLNALSSECFSKQSTNVYDYLNDTNSFDEIDFSIVKKAVVVGALVPIIKTLKKSEIDFTILEQDKRTLKEDELEFYLPSERADEVIPNADLVVITGVTILNGTLEGLLKLVKENAQVIVTGPTVPLIPTIFFDKKVSAIGGTIVTKPDDVLNIISEGGSGYHFFGKSADRWVIKKK